MKIERIKYIDLLYSIYANLKDTFGKGYKFIIDASKQEINKPTFLVQIRPSKSDSYREYNRELINVTITYTNSVIQQEETLQIKSDLNELFDLGINVNGAFLYLDNKNFSGEEGEYINFNFSVDYFNAKSEKNIYNSDKYTEMFNELDISYNDRSFN